MPSSKNHPHRYLAAISVAFLLVVGTTGCPTDDSVRNTEASKAAKQKSAVTLSIAVQDDVDIVRAFERLRGEWSEHSGGEIQIVPFEKGDGFQQFKLASEASDLIVFSSRYLGELCEEDSIRIVRPSVFRNEELIYEDFFPLLRTRETSYGKKLMALSIGCPVPLMTSEQSTSISDSQLVLPDSDVDIALSFLAWAAPYVIHPSREATLFQTDNDGKLRTRISEEPFVKALEDYLTASGRESEATCEIIWPDRRSSEEASKLTQIAAPIPTNVRYSPLANNWEIIPDRELPVPLLASRGQLIAVTTKSKNAAAAFRFMSWLASPANCRLISTASSKVANPRGSFAKSSDDWLGDDKTRGKLCSNALADCLRANQALMIPRIQEIDRYLSKLGASIRKATDENSTAQAALIEAASQWDSLTEELGNSDQQNAYLRSLGQLSYEPGS